MRNTECKKVKSQKYNKIPKEKYIHTKNQQTTTQIQITTKYTNKYRKKTTKQMQEEYQTTKKYTQNRKELQKLKQILPE